MGVFVAVSGLCQGQYRNLPSRLFPVADQYPVADRPLVVVTGDLNGDRVPDLAVTTETTGEVWVHFGLGDGTFGPGTPYATGRAPQGIALADFDGDGHTDMVTANLLDDNAGVLINAGDGTFEPPVFVPANASPLDVGTGDFNGDDHADFAISSPEDADVLVFLGNGDGTFGGPTRVEIPGSSVVPIAIDVADADGDGDLDIAVVSVESGPDSLRIILNTDAGFVVGPKFEVSGGPEDVVLADFNGDGLSDIATASSRADNLIGRVGIRLNTGIGRDTGEGMFGAIEDENFAPGSGPADIEPADLDRDGDIDLAVVNLRSKDVTILLNDGGGPDEDGDPTFEAFRSYIAAIGPETITVGDFDGDGDGDIAIANFKSDSLSVILNSGDGRFVAEQRLPTFGAPDGIVFADLTGDGLPDIASTNGTREDCCQGEPSPCDRDLCANVSLLVNVGDNVFEPLGGFAADDRPREIVAGDFDGDGDVDLAVTGSLGDEVTVALNDGDGVYSDVARVFVGQGPAGLALGDVDADGRVDLVTTTEVTGELVYLRNTGGLDAASMFALVPGGVSPAAGDLPKGVALINLDADAELEAVVLDRGLTFDGQTDRARIFDFDGMSFVEIGGFDTGDGPEDLAVRDLNGDGRPDLAVANRNGESVNVFFGSASGGFDLDATYATTDVHFGIEIADVDGDGDGDILVTNSASLDDVGVLLNRGDGRFDEPIRFGIGGSPAQIAVADSDLDGDLDFVATNFGTGDVTLLVNQSIPTRAWIGGVEAAIDDASNWTESRELMPTDAGVFDASAVGGAGAMDRSVMLSDSIALGALGLADGSVRLDLGGNEFSVIGVPQATGGLGVDLGIESCDGVVPLGAPAAELWLSSSAGGSASLFDAETLIVGRTRDAGLRVEAPAGAIDIVARRQLLVGDFADGEVVLRGSNVSLEYGVGLPPAADVVIGVDGAGVLRVLDGATFESGSVAGAFAIGRDPFGAGELVVDGAGSLWQHTGQRIAIGQAGAGLLTASDGGQILTNALVSMDVARENGSRAEVRLSGSPLTWRNFGAPVVVGRGGMLTGDGELFSTNGVFNGGVIAPDPSGDEATAVFTVIGDYVQADAALSPTSAGRLDLDVVEAGDGFATDRVEVRGVASLGGGLVVESVGGTPTAGELLPPFFVADELSPDASGLDVVSAPVFEVLDPGTGMLVPGTLVPTSAAARGSGVSLSLRVVTIDSILGDDSGFDADGRPNDAALGDVTGDGVDDLVVAVPEFEGRPTGFVALLVGETDAGGSFSFGGFVSYDAEADAPVAVEIGNYDGVDGNTLEIAFANRGEAGDNDIHVIRYAGGMLVDDGGPTLFVAADRLVKDLVTIPSPAGMPDKIAAVSSVIGGGPGGNVGFATVSTRRDMIFESCDIPVEGDPDSGDPVDIDGLSVGRETDAFGTGLALTVPDLDRVVVLVNDAADPLDWSRLVFSVAGGPRAVRAGDLDGDGLPDIVVASGTLPTVSVLRNTTSANAASFALAVAVPGVAAAGSLTLADVDRDGDRDLVVVGEDAGGNGRGVFELRNTSPNLGTVSLAAAVPFETQAAGEPVLVLSADLDGQSTLGVADDVVVLVDPPADELGRERDGGRSFGDPHRFKLGVPDCLPDVNNDGVLNGADFNAWLTAFGNGSLAADQNRDGVLNGADFNAWLTNFGLGCP